MAPYGVRLTVPHCSGLPKSARLLTEAQETRCWTSGLDLANKVLDGLLQTPAAKALKGPCDELGFMDLVGYDGVFQSAVIRRSFLGRSP